MSTDNTITKTDLKNILEEIGNIGGGGGTVDSTSVPTASKVSEFDSNAKMNSTDMTSTQVDDFVDGLNVSGGGLISTDTYNGASYMVVKAYRWANIVTINLRASQAASMTKNTWITICTLNEKYRPPESIDFVISDNSAGSASTVPVVIRIQSSGLVTMWVYSDISSNQPFGYATYITTN